MIRIAIIEDHAIVREGLRGYLSSFPDFIVVAEAASGKGVVDIVRSGCVDVILLDLSMPNHSGVDALGTIRARDHDLPVLVLSGFPEEQFAVNLLKQGASGYLNKECDPEEIARAIRTVCRGRKYISARVAQLLAEGLDDGGTKANHELLTAREFQIFMQLANGRKLGTIAEELSLSVKTVSTYRTQVMTKMQLSTNSELTYYAIKEGLVQSLVDRK